MNNVTEVMRITREGVWVNPDMAANETAKAVLDALDSYIKVLVQNAVEAEREACAKVCEKEQFELTQNVDGNNFMQHFDAGCRSCAEMIRARGET